MAKNIIGSQGQLAQEQDKGEYQKGELEQYQGIQRQ
jgi:hypothetical protein